MKNNNETIKDLSDLLKECEIKLMKTQAMISEYQSDLIEDRIKLTNFTTNFCCKCEKETPHFVMNDKALCSKCNPEEFQIYLTQPRSRYDEVIQKGKEIKNNGYYNTNSN